MPGRVCLDVVAGPIQGRHFEFDAHDTFLFGRSPECHAELAADDTTASRHHFLLEVKVADGPSLEVAVTGDRIPAAGDPVRLAADPAAIVALP